MTYALFSGAFSGLPPWPYEITDDFNRADGAMGSNWGNWRTGSSQPTILGNKITSTGVGGFRRIAVRWAVQQLGPDVRMLVKLINWGGSIDNAELDILLRASTTDVDTASYYGFQFSDSNNAINYYNAGAFVSTLVSDNLVTFSSGDILGAFCIGSNFKMTKNGVIILSTTNASITTAGWAALELTMSTDNGSALDDFAVGTLRKAAPSSVVRQPQKRMAFR